MFSKNIVTEHVLTVKSSWIRGLNYLKVCTRKGNVTKGSNCSKVSFLRTLLLAEYFWFLIQETKFHLSRWLGSPILTFSSGTSIPYKSLEYANLDGLERYMCDINIVMDKVCLLSMLKGSYAFKNRKTRKQRQQAYWQLTNRHKQIWKYSEIEKYLLKSPLSLRKPLHKKGRSMFPVWNTDSSSLGELSIY